MDTENFDQSFKAPEEKYRSALFWAWNTRLDKEEMSRQIEAFKKMGLGGFYMHSRIGLETEYLGEEYFSAIEYCIEKAKSLGMYAELYDEDLWPSGNAGGLVTDAHPEYRRTSLLFSPQKYDKENYSYLGEYKIYLDEKDRLAKKGRELCYHAYSVTAPDALPYQAAALADPLNKEGVKLFIGLTHEKYKERVRDDFGKTVTKIFTDEPTFDTLFPKHLYLPDTSGEGEFGIPWSLHFEELFFEEYGYSILEKLPELVFERSSRSDFKTRYAYRKLLSKLFRRNYFDPIYTWCEQNGLRSTGHVLYEETLASQARSSGEAMEQYAAMHIPGMDLLFDEVQYNTAKQVQSVVHQMDKEGMMSELYGVTGWDFDFRDYKFQGDWQAALGVTHRVPHLGWLSMHGPAKRDYPASIGVQSPWYREFSFLEDHYARLNTALTRGEPVVKLGVIHPIASYWISMGTESQTGAKREKLEHDFASLAKQLLENNFDFDYISESLAEQWGASESGCVGKMCYETVIVPDLFCLRESTVQYLEKQLSIGGRVIFLGDCPFCIEADGDRLQRIYEKSEHCTAESLCTSLEACRTVKIETASGRGMIYTLRKEAEVQWLFCAYSQKGADTLEQDGITITLKGSFSPLLYNTVTGEQEPVEYVICGEQTVIKLSVGYSDSILLQLCPETEEKAFGLPEKAATEKKRLENRLIRIYGEEENVLLLDTAEYSFDGEHYFPKKNILKADRAFREQYRLPIRSNYNRAQPWKQKDGRRCVGKLYLRFRIDSDMVSDDILLGLENLEDTEIFWNGEAVKKTPCGYYADAAIEKIKLPALRKGENLLLLVISMCDSNILGAESCYLLGDFGISLDGGQARITQKSDKVAYLPTTALAMPFYGGNLFYESEFETEDGEISLHLPRYRGACVRVYLDGIDKGLVCLSPYRLSLGAVTEGKHKLTLKLYGNRHNVFGPLHYKGPQKGALPMMWEPMPPFEVKEYLLTEIGILNEPIIEIDRRLPQKT